MVKKRAIQKFVIVFNYSYVKLYAFVYAAFFWIVLPFPLFAQINEVGTRQKMDLSQPPVPNPPPKPVDYYQHLLGNWEGGRSWLISHGIDLTPTFMVEAAGNVSGGISQGSDYVGRFGLSVEIDGEKLAGARGLKLHGLMIKKFGRDLSADHLGGDPYSVMELYGTVGTRLQYLYFTEDLLSKKLQFGVGRLNQSLLFDSSPVYCNFLSLALCAVPKVLPGANFDGFYNSAKNNWAGFIRYRPIAEIYFQIGAFESSPVHGGTHGFDWSIKNDIGVNIPFQLGWEPGGGKGQLPSHFSVGGYYDTSPLSDIYYDINGNKISATGLKGQMDHGHTAFWVQADHMLWRNGSPSNAGMVVFGNFTTSDPHVSAFHEQFSIGFEDVGQIRSRPGDAFGIQVTRTFQSKYNRKRQIEYYNLYNKYPNGMHSPQNHEVIIEAQYSFHVYHGFDLQPDFQYIIHPNSQSSIPNAAVFVGRARISL